MRIALFPPSLEVGGVQRVILNLAQGFLDDGLAVDLVLIKSGGDYQDQIPAGARTIDLGASRALTSVPKLARYLRRERPDVLLAASEPVNLAAIWARMLARVPTRIAVSVLNTPSAYEAHVTRARERLYPLLTRWFYPRADYVIAIAEYIRRDLAQTARLPLEDIHTIYTPIINADFHPRAQQPVDHPWLNDGADVPLIVGVGRFVQQKDLATLIRAFAVVRQSRTARLIIIGDGPERAALEALVADLGLGDDVSMPGFADNLPYMRAADVFVLSSLFEGLPTVLIEALALSTAIVSTDCPGGVREILDDGRLGRLAPVGDVDGLAAGICAALDDPIDVSHLRDHARHFESDQVIARYRDYFNL